MRVLRVMVMMAIVVSAVALAAPVDGKSKTAGKSNTKPAATQNDGLPKGAEKIGDATWRYKDPKGKTWIYSKTLFGYSRRPETAESAEAPIAKQKESAAFTVVAVKDGVVTFQSKSVFGASRWNRKIDELTADEKASYEAYQQAAAQE